MNRNTHQTGTIDETRLVRYVHGCGLIQKACIDYCNLCVLLIDIITRGQEFSRVFQQPQCELDICKPIAQVRAKGDGHRVERELFITWRLDGRN